MSKYVRGTEHISEELARLMMTKRQKMQPKNL